MMFSETQKTLGIRRQWLLQRSTGQSTDRANPRSSLLPLNSFVSCNPDSRGSNVIQDSPFRSSEYKNWWRSWNLCRTNLLRLNSLAMLLEWAFMQRLTWNCEPDNKLVTECSCKFSNRLVQRSVHTPQPNCCKCQNFVSKCCMGETCCRHGLAGRILVQAKKHKFAVR